MDCTLNRSILNSSRQVPRILRHQILCTLTEQFLQENLPTQRSKTAQMVDPRAMTEPSIQRFYGAMLFVDISGFTALSLRLDVESLKNHINDYFTKMLDIVDKWGGDVIKFAGDALYIIWSTEVSSSKTSDSLEESLKGGMQIQNTITTAAALQFNPLYQMAAKIAIEKAAACGLEINAQCSNHKIILSAKSNAASPWNMVFSSLPNLLGSAERKVAPSPPVQTQATEAFLNVHSGVGYGLMVGIDIGSYNRWEYFLLGDPITQVAAAESRAAMGDVVISGIAHDLMHPATPTGSKNPSPTASIDSSILPCGCTSLDDGFCKICNLDVDKVKRPVPLTKRRSRNKMLTEESGGTLASTQSEVTDRVSEELIDDLDSIFSIIQSTLKQRVLDYVSVNNVNVGKLLNINEDLYITDVNNVSKDIERFCLDFLIDKIQPSFQSLVQQSMLEDLIRHNHEASRSRSEFYYSSRIGGLLQLLFEEIPIDLSASLPSPNDPVPPLLRRQSTDSFRNLFRMISKTDVNSRSSGEFKLFRRQSSRNNRALSTTRNSKASIVVEEAGLSAELRTVTVMFIKIESITSEIYVDKQTTGDVMTSDQQLTTMAGRFHFLQRTHDEQEKDKELLKKLQSCMEVLCKAFAIHGGQMRQFIIDDKGTVCIGTFGLRGSTAIDNAAAAVEVGKEIVISLQGLGLVASIGITSGKAYCGWVGSPSRHEFAVMGPSTNLSARLMSQAPAYCLVCDQEIKSKDRTHGFELIGEIKAKGYTQLVKTYKPVFEDLGNAKGLSDAAMAALSPSTVARNHFQGMLRSSRDSFSLSSLLMNSKIGELGSFRNSERSKRSMAVTPKSQMVLKERDKPKVRDTLSTIGVLVESEFHFARKQGNSQMDVVDSSINDEGTQKQQSRLYGREEEMTVILKFLFLGIVKNVLHRKAPHKDQISRFWHNLNTSLPCRMVVLGGKEGVGKSAIMNSIARKFFSMHKKDHGCNIAVLKNRSNISFNTSSSPLFAWRSILQDMLRYMYSFNSTSSSSPNKALSSQNLLSKSEISEGLEKLIPGLPEDLHPYIPLLSWMGVIPHVPDTDMTTSLHGPQKAAKVIDLIVYLIQSFAAITRQVSFLVLEQLQYFDAWSLSLLHKIWTNTTGVIILASIPTKQSHDVNQSPYLATISEDGRSLGSNGHMSLSSPSNDQQQGGSLDSHALLRKFNDQERCLTYDISVLKKEAMMKIVKEILNPTKQHVSDDILDKIYVVSGGNALYAYEIAHSIVNKAMKNKTVSLLSHLEQHLLSNSSGRIEEVICYRFDQLDAISQVVLKNASVIASNGYPFNLQTLTYVILEHDVAMGAQKQHHHHSDQPLRHSESSGMHNSSLHVPEAAIVASFQKLLQDEEFLTMCDGDVDQSMLSPSQSKKDKTKSDFPSIEVKEGDLNVAVYTNYFTFRAVIEQMTIYNLLIQEQKEQIHEKVAFYYHMNPNASLHEHKQMFNQPSKIAGTDTEDREETKNRADLGKLVNIRALLEIGYHWQHASVLNDALKTYYLAVQAAKHVQQSADQEDIYLIQYILTLCQEVYVMMKHDMSIQYNTDMSFQELQSIVENTPIGISSVLTNSDRANNMGQSFHVFTYTELLEMCYDDVEILYIIVNVLINIAQYSLIYYTNPSLIILTSTEALELLHLIIQNPPKTQASNAKTTESSLMGKVGLTINTNGSFLHSATAGTPRSTKIRSTHNTPKHSTVANTQPKKSSVFVFNPTLMKYHIYNIYLQIHSLSLAKDPIDKLDKALFVSTYMIEHAEVEFNQHSNVHLLQSYASRLMVLLRKNDQSVEKTMEMVDKIMSQYHADALSPHIVYYYALDNILYILAVALQYCLTKTQLTFVVNHFPKLLQELYNVTHIYSIITCSVPIISLCMCLRRYKEALTLVEYVQGLSIYADTNIARNTSKDAHNASMDTSSMMIDHIFLSDAYLTRLHTLLLLLDQLFPTLQPDTINHSMRSIRSNISLKLRTSGTLRADYLLSHEFYNDLSQNNSHQHDMHEDADLYNMIIQSTSTASNAINPIIESYLFFSGLSETTLYALSVLIKNYYQYSMKKVNAIAPQSEPTLRHGASTLHSLTTLIPVEEDIFPWKKITLYIEKLCKRCLHYQLGSVNVYHILLLVHSVLLQYDLSGIQEGGSGLNEYAQFMILWIQLAEEFVYYHTRYNSGRRYRGSKSNIAVGMNVSKPSLDDGKEDVNGTEQQANAENQSVPFDLLIAYTIVYIFSQVVFPPNGSSKSNRNSNKNNNNNNNHHNKRSEEERGTSPAPNTDVTSKPISSADVQKHLFSLKDEIENKYMTAEMLSVVQQHFQTTSMMTGAIKVSAPAPSKSK